MRSVIIIYSLTIKWKLVIISGVIQIIIAISKELSLFRFQFLQSILILSLIGIIGFNIPGISSTGILMCVLQSHLLLLAISSTSTSALFRVKYFNLREFLMTAISLFAAWASKCYYLLFDVLIEITLDATHIVIFFVTCGSNLMLLSISVFWNWWF